MARSRSGPRSGASRKPESSAPTWDERIIAQMVPWQREILGLLLFLLSALVLLSLLGLTESVLLAPLSNLLRQVSGWGAYPLILTFALSGLYLAIRRMVTFVVRSSQLIGFELMLLAALPLVHILLGGGLVGALDGRGGGLIGWALSEPLVDFLGPVLALLLHAGLFTWGLALVSRFGWGDAIRWLQESSAQLRRWSDELEEDVAERKSQPSPVEPGVPVRRAITQPGGTTSTVAARTDDELIIIDDSAAGVTRGLRRRSRKLPPLDVLEEGAVLTLTSEEIDAKKRVIEQTLQDFGLPALVTEIRRGPAVTQFGVQPGYLERPGPDGQLKQYKVRIGQIAALQNDLALALKAPRLRIEAPVPGRGIVGVEVPNAATQVVRLRSVVESEVFQQADSPLTLALGKDVAGAPVITDLGTLPHLLIAGTTGSGKSVSLISMITCLVFNNSPDRLRLVMIDPKKVELIRFNGLPHLLGKVEVEGERIIGVLRWLTSEMDRRYELFATLGAKHLKDYNRRARRREGMQQLPYVAVFIDELADLMATYPADVERTLCRLAQMARATGIHLVVATQRPSTDVITGLIKANFPARASFAVSSGTDSRVILDTVGAEQLLGYGDLLYLPPDAAAPLRLQGCFISDLEIEAVVNFWQAQPEEQPGTEDAPWEKMIVRQAFVDDKDEMLERAIALVQKVDRISTSYIQRRLRVGYPRAARLMETLYEMGLVEDPKEGGKTRKTYVEGDEDPLDDYLAGQEA